LQKETSAGMYAGAVTGLCFGLFSTSLYFALTWQSFLRAMTEATYEMPLSVSPSYFVYGLYSLVILASLLDMLPGMMIGLFFVKVVNRVTNLSTYIKSVVFGVCMWLVPCLVAISVYFAYEAYLSTIVAFILLLLILIVLDSMLFAYLFKRWSKPLTVNVMRTGLPSFLTLHRLGLFGSVAIVGVMCMMLWRVFQLLPSLGSSLTSQLVFVTSIGISLFFIYALIQILGLLRRK